MKLQLVLLILLLTACNSAKKINVITDGHNSENSLDWAGTYQGTLPCADCLGMETKLDLNQDKTYSLSTVYQGKSDQIFIEKGSFQWNGAGSTITLNIKGKASRNHQYLVIENGLIKLDRQGNKITGNLKDNYKLFKNNSTSYNLKLNEHVYWINSRKVKCTGVAPMMCLQIQKSETATADNWKYFYDTIKGFDFEAGYIYKLIIRETKPPISEVPADASMITYELVKIMEKNNDNNLRLHDIWALTSIKGKAINLKKFQKHPLLEINLTENRVMGNDGCNNFTGEIKTVNSQQIGFDKLAGTRMACPNMELSSEILISLNQVQSYQLNNLQLVLYNSSGTELLRFKKVD